ncbi:hypothetical protein ACIRBY_15215 [Streptomyces sp. NPDC096136]|uniref:hypothetical protein n=1 Tax=Streptomyces sp. NPDC096136 TaxID=3366076 RepID=UPI00381B83A6
MTGSAVVPVLGLAAVTAAGCVWYVPSLAELRAGADRPASRRLAAAGCLVGWSAVALLVPLLSAPGWALPGAAVAVAGAAATVVLRLLAVAVRRREEREAAADWAALRLPDPLPGDGGDRAASPGRVAAGLGLALAAGPALVLGAAALGAGPAALLLGPAVPVAAVAAVAARAARRPRG